MAYGETWNLVCGDGLTHPIGTAQQVYNSVVNLTNRTEVGGQGTMFSSCTLSVDDRECVLICTNTTTSPTTTDTTTKNSAAPIHNAQSGRAGAPMVFIGLAGNRSETGIGAPPSMSVIQELATHNGWGTVSYVEFVSSSGTPYTTGLISISISGSYVVSTTDRSNAGTSTTSVILYAKHDPIALTPTVDWSYQLSKLLTHEENFAFVHSSGVFQPDKFYAYDNVPSHQVVVMGGQEYNQTNALTGWIGVV